MLSDPRNRGDDEADTLQYLVLGDFGGGADLDKHGSQHAQGRRKYGKCCMYVNVSMCLEGTLAFLTDLQFQFGMNLCDCCLVCYLISVL